MMNNYKLYLFLSFLLLVTACEKEEVVIYESGPKTNGCATALKNGTEFSASCFFSILGDNDDELGVTFVTYNVEGVLIERFYILVPLATGVYTTENFIEIDRANISAAAGYYDETDIRYEMDKGKNNRVEVQVLDTTTLEVSGIFDIYLEKESGGGDYPSKLSMTEGVFSGTLTE